MKKIFAANWKMNKSPNEAREFMNELSQKISKIDVNKIQFILFPSALAVDATLGLSKNLSLSIGVQNAYFAGSGAFTGENSAAVAKSMGCEYVLIGHSERRTLFSETDEFCQKKISFVQSLGMIPMLCIGEVLAERQSGQTFQVLKNQLHSGLKEIDPAKKIIVAYEPVWAIGTGQVATVEQVRETHAMIHAELLAMGYQNVPLLYGGSVKAENAGELSRIPHVDGFLIGGASLQVDSYLAIAQASLN